MAISPPSDIVLDVLNNADPSRLEVAQAQLKAGQATAEAKRLASTDASFNATLMKDAVSDAHKLKHRLDGVEKKEIPGTTGGALDSREAEPGPIFLQGDHGRILYRNLVLTPALEP